MTINWSAAARADLGRLYEFLAETDLELANKVLDRLIAAPGDLRRFPRRGPRLSEFNPREVREYRVGVYLLRYELSEANIYVLRIFHVREDRFSGASRR
jgi:plasmid stabilization system protein ParE